MRRGGILGTAIAGCMVAGPVGAQALFQESFEKGAGGWTRENQATVSDIARRPGGKSLLIKQWKDEEQNSVWLSPAIKNPGKPVKISFWAADNYLRQRDFSYAAAVDGKTYSRLGGMQFAGFNANIDARLEKWREFELTP